MPEVTPEMPAQPWGEWVPAPHQLVGSSHAAVGNHDRKRDPGHPAVRYVVIHGTEETYDETLRLVQLPERLGWHFTVRSHDGHVAQHLPASLAVGRHSGNWWMNMHSVGIEHEALLAEGERWLTDALYESSSRLVRRLGAELGVPLDRAHLLAHGMVPAMRRDRMATMHVDPGPQWDWERWFALLGAPLDAGTREGSRRQGPLHEVVRVLPGFDDNPNVLSGVQGSLAQRTNFVYVHIAPDAAAPLVTDAATGRAATHGVGDVAGRASAGQDFVAVERRGEWVAIWFSGQLGWIHDPDARPVTRVVPSALLARPAEGASQVFGRPWPSASSYPAGVPVARAEALPWAFPAQQAYVVTDADIPDDEFVSGGLDPERHVLVEDAARWVQLSYGARIAFVPGASVEVTQT